MAASISVLEIYKAGNLGQSEIIEAVLSTGILVRILVEKDQKDRASRQNNSRPTLIVQCLLLQFPLVPIWCRQPTLQRRRCLRL